MAVTAVVFDVGESLVDETGNWEAVADACGVPRFTLMALAGAAIERGESHRWGVEKPAAGFFDRVVAATGRPAAEVAYVGDLVHNDVVPALAAGVVAVHIRRGPWGHLHEPPDEAIRIRTLDELPAALP